MSSVCSAFSRPARCFDRALRPGPLAALALIALTALLASCQPLPHPFADDRPPAELLAVPESAGVSIAPVEGLPGAIAAKLGAATARALLGHDIPASEKTTGHGTFQLYGQLIQSEQSGRSGVAVLWRLEDAKGRQIGEREVAIEGTAEDWQSPDGAMIERVAALTADAVAPLLLKESAAREIRRPLAAGLRPGGAGRAAGVVPGETARPGTPPCKSRAPGPRLGEAGSPDTACGREPAAQTGQRAAPGGRAPRDRRSRRWRHLARRAITSFLRQQDLTIVEPGGKADFYIDGEVSIAPAGSGKQHIKIVWRVRGASGAEIGTVGQENDVPSGSLSGPWGDVAYIVALAAGEGLVQVLARAGPPATPAAATGPEAAPSAEKAAAKSPEAAAPSKTGKTKEKR